MNGSSLLAFVIYIFSQNLPFSSMLMTWDSTCLSKSELVELDTSHISRFSPESSVPWDFLHGVLATNDILLWKSKTRKRTKTWNKVSALLKNTLKMGRERSIITFKYRAQKKSLRCKGPPPPLPINENVAALRFFRANLYVLPAFQT